MTPPVHMLTADQIRRLRADAPHFAPENDIPVQMLCDMALALLEERDRLRFYISRVRDAEFYSGGDLSVVSKVLQEEP